MQMGRSRGQMKNLEATTPPTMVRVFSPSPNAQLEIYEQCYGRTNSTQRDIRKGDTINLSWTRHQQYKEARTINSRETRGVENEPQKVKEQPKPWVEIIKGLLRTMYFVVQS